MSRYVRVHDGQAHHYTITDLRRDRADVSFPSHPADDVLADFGVYPLHTVEHPEYNPLTHRVVEGDPIASNDKWLQTWQLVPLTADEIDQAHQQAREQAKLQRQAAVDAIQVTTQAGNTFQGDETSQTRMSRVIIALQATGAQSVNWVLADNTVIQATAAELTEALSMAGAEQARLWVMS